MERSQFDEFEKWNLEMKAKQFEEKWAQSISIAFFMHVQFIPLKKIRHQLQFSDIFSTKFHCLIVLLSSSLLFMISTENRLIYLDSEFHQNKQKFKIKSIFE